MARGFGDPGFYFVVDQGSTVWARYVRAMKESIHVYAAEPDTLRADHTLRVWGRVFLRLHYRMVRKQGKPPVMEVSGVQAQAGAP